MLVGGVLWLMGTPFLQHDTEVATTRLPEAQT